MTETQSDQTAAIAFLKTHETRGPSIANDVIQTHGALVFQHNQTLADLGLSDVEIGRYFRIPHEVVTQLREIWSIDGTV